MMLEENEAVDHSHTIQGKRYLSMTFFKIWTVTQNEPFCTVWLILHFEKICDVVGLDLDRHQQSNRLRFRQPSKEVNKKQKWMNRTRSSIIGITALKPPL